MAYQVQGLFHGLPSPRPTATRGDSLNTLSFAMASTVVSNVALARHYVSGNDDPFRNGDTFYDKGSTFPLNCILDDGVP